jgi:hypothetical protein
VSNKLNDPQAAVTKWTNAMANATPAYTAGVQAVTVAPNQKAAAASAKWLARTQAALTKYEQNNLKVSLQSWQTATVDKGAPRLASGASGAANKVLAFNTAFYNFLKAGQATINAMPTDTPDQAIAKSAAQIRYNMTFPGYTRP